MPTKFFKDRKTANVEVKAPEPRKLEDIQKEYTELKYRLGEVQYLTFVYDLEVQTLCEQMRVINNEAAARQKLDTETKAVDEAKNAKS